MANETRCCGPECCADDGPEAGCCDEGCCDDGGCCGSAPREAGAGAGASRRLGG